MIDYEKVLKSLASPFMGMNVDKVMIQQRDKSVPEKMNSFIVISLPVTIYSKTYGKGYNLYNSFCRVEIFVRKKGSSGTIALKKLNELSLEAQSKFPISDGNILATKPRVVLDGDDNNGFSVITIQATLQIV